MHALGRELVLTRNERQIAQVVVDTARLLSWSPVCGLWLVDEQDDTLVGWAHTHGAHVVALDALPLDSEKGIIPAVARGGELVYVPDAAREPRCIDIGPESQSQLCAPLKVQGRTIGVLNTESEELDAFDEADRQLFSTLADQAAVAIENARLHGDIRRRNEELLALNAIATTLGQPLDLERLLNAAMDEVLAVMGMDGGSIVLLDEEDDGSLALVAHRGFSSESVEEIKKLKPGKSIAIWTLRSGQPVANHSISNDYTSRAGIVSIRFDRQPSNRTNRNVIGTTPH